MYIAPEVRELGTVTAFTLGSSRGIQSTQKANNDVNDQYDSNPLTAPLYGKGNPCSTTLPIGTYNCS